MRELDNDCVCAWLNNEKICWVAREAKRALAELCEPRTRLFIQVCLAVRVTRRAASSSCNIFITVVFSLSFRSCFCTETSNNVHSGRGFLFLFMLQFGWITEFHFCSSPRRHRGACEENKKTETISLFFSCLIFICWIHDVHVNAKAHRGALEQTERN